MVISVNLSTLKVYSRGFVDKKPFTHKTDTNQWVKIKYKYRHNNKKIYAKEYLNMARKHKM